MTEAVPWRLWVGEMQIPPLRCGMTKRLRGMTKRLCGMTKRLCGMTKRLRGVTKRLCYGMITR